MGKIKRSSVAGRAWHLLRLSMLWARKGGAFRMQKLVIDLRPVPKYLKSLRPSHSSKRLGYRERQFSFNETPEFHIKMHRPASLRHLRIPCISSPMVDFDDDDGRINFFLSEQETGLVNIEGTRDNYVRYDDLGDEMEEEEEEIDSKAEEFIADFYEQMKLQRQVSFLQYNEMLHRGTR